VFWEGKLAMEIDNGGVAGIFNQQAPTLPLAAAPSPFPTRAQGLVLAPLTVNANTKHKAAAFTFYKWVLQPENQKELQDLLGASNVATVVQRSPEDLVSDRGSRCMTIKRRTAFRSSCRVRSSRHPRSCRSCSSTY